MVVALHPAGRRRQRAARDVIERAARLDHRLLADHAFALHLVAGAAAVGDGPFAADQLNGGLRGVLDADVVGPEPAAAARLRLLRQEAHRHPDGHVAGRGAVGKEAFHARFPLLIAPPRQSLARPGAIREGAPWRETGARRAGAATKRGNSRPIRMRRRWPPPCAKSPPTRRWSPPPTPVPSRARSPKIGRAHV